MKIYIKRNNTLYKDTPLGKVFDSVNDIDVNELTESEVVFVKNGGIYQKINSTLINVSTQQPVKESQHVGDIVIYCGIDNPDPSTLLLCNGNSFDTTLYPELYNILGTNVVPDIYKLLFRGDGENSNISSHDVIEMLAIQSSRVSYHTHSITVPNHKHSISNGRTHNHFSNGRNTSETGKESSFTPTGYMASGSQSGTSSSNNSTYSFGSKTPTWSIGNITSDTTYGTARIDSNVNHTNVISQKHKYFLILIRAKVE